MKHMLKKSFAVIMTLALLLAGCGGSQSSSASPTAGDVNSAPSGNGSPKMMTLASASLGGTYYIIGSGVAEAINKKVPTLTVNNVIAQGSTGNPKMIQNKEVELGMTNYYSGMNAINGNAPYTEKIDLKGICTLQYSVLQFYTFANRDDINTIADLKGKRVAIGPAGGGGALLYKEILPFWGIKAEDTTVSYLSYGDGGEALKDKKIDVNVPHGAPPLEAISGNALTDKVKIIPLETEKLAEITKQYPYYDAAIIPGGTYKNIDEDVQSVGIQDILTVSGDMSDEDVYAITKAIYESIEDLRKIHPSLADMTFEGYKHSLVPLHPGALKFYQEMNIPLE